MKEKHLLIILGVLLIALIGFYLSYQNSNIVCIENKKCFSVDLADDSEEWRIGLSNYEILPLDSGMLFIFPEEADVNFWMKSMDFAIDIIWISSDFKITGFEKSVPICVENCEIYSSEGKIKYVLEINSGLSEIYSFEFGDEVSLKE